MTVANPEGTDALESAIAVIPLRERGALSMLKSPSLSFAACEESPRPEVALVSPPRSLSDSLPDPGPEKGEHSSDLTCPPPFVAIDEPRVAGKGRVARVAIGEVGSADYIGGHTEGSRRRGNWKKAERKRKKQRMRFSIYMQ